jgi:hypothetical protein
MPRCHEDLSVGEDLLVLQPDSIYQRWRIEWHGCPDSTAATRDTLQRAGHYRLTGDSLVLTFGDGSEVEREMLGRMRGDTITVFGENVARAFHYRRRIRP